ncbi:hypothetical protein H5410_004272 [Solanum commersonii]|uniref:Uncharacterized protein n=1 Tax=Solanum commersonii TaxID=4109 RepID=A0A9J6B7I4_SOLCO|nr:hypothetical protein H5410_004272 [Solanum commersonii]
MSQSYCSVVAGIGCPRPTTNTDAKHQDTTNVDHHQRPTLPSLLHYRGDEPSHFGFSPAALDANGAPCPFVWRFDTYVQSGHKLYHVSGPQTNFIHPGTTQDPMTLTPNSYHGFQYDKKTRLETHRSCGEENFSEFEESKKELPPVEVLNLLRDSRKPTQLEKGKGILKSPTIQEIQINVIIWNAKGVNNTSFRRKCQDLVHMHKTSVIVLLETKVTGHAKIIEELVFDAQIQSIVKRFLDSNVIMWKEDSLKLDNNYVTPQGINVMVKVTSYPICGFSLLFMTDHSSFMRTKRVLGHEPNCLTNVTATTPERTLKE